MGNRAINKCIFTGLTVQNITNGNDGIEYNLAINSKNYHIYLPWDATEWENENDFFKENKHLLVSLLYNDKWIEDYTELLTIEKLKEIINNNYFPQTPQEKLDNLFLHFYELQKEDGVSFMIKLIDYQENIWRKTCFKSFLEFKFYLDNLLALELLDGIKYGAVNNISFISDCRITLKGLNHVIRLRSKGSHSNKCFVAMAFDDRTLDVRKAIKKALIKTGFDPIVVDEQHIKSDQTINDRIIADLKQCRFCVADFTFHRNGVYFESGFAAGQGKKVIYTCEKEEFKKAHFDIKPLQHIIYSKPEELEERLIDKIEAWIL